MIQQLKIYLKTEKELNINMSSLMQGIIMENTSYDFAESAHTSNIRNYSQYLTKENEKWVWVINTLDNSAKENITDNIINMENFFIKKKEIFLEVEKKETKTTNFDELFESYYYCEELPSRFVNLDILTPMAFKSNETYINFPTVKLIFSGLINKYDSISDITELKSENLIEELTKSVSIYKYNLRSCVFHLEGVKIPAFMGKITFKTNGSKNMVSMVNMLADFAQYSGIGIKSAIGMGAVVKNKERRMKA